MAVITESDRLVIREWTEADADDALAIYGSLEVARWLSPAASACRASPANSSGLPDGVRVDAVVAPGPRCGSWLAHAASTSSAASSVGPIERALVLRIMAASLTA